MKNLILLVSMIFGITAGMDGQTLKLGKLTNLRQLTSDAGIRYENPQLSPDGKQVAFTQFGYDGLYVVSLDKNVKSCLSEASGVGYMYQWSADSREILMRDTRYVASPSGMRRLHAIWSVDLSGRMSRRSQDSEYMQPGAWRYNSTSGRYVVCPDAVIVPEKGVRQLSALETAAISLPAYNVSFITDCDNLYVVSSTGVKRLIYSGPAFFPRLSPDGSRVAFVNHRDEIIVMGIDGSNQRKVTHGFSPSWASNEQIVFERTTDDGHEYTSGNLFIINVNGAGERQLTDSPSRIDMNASVSADGTKIVFTDYAGGQVYIADLK